MVGWRCRVRGRDDARPPRAGDAPIGRCAAGYPLMTLRVFVAYARVKVVEGVPFQPHPKQEKPLENGNRL